MRIVVRYANNPDIYRNVFPVTKSHEAGEGTTGFTALELGGNDMGPERAGGKPLPGRLVTRRSVLTGVGAGARPGRYRLLSGSLPGAMP